MRLKSPDLIGAGLISLFTIVVTAIIYSQTPEPAGFPIWFLPFGILMVLFIPGYVLTHAILPQLDRATILLLSLGISVSISAMGGMILHYTARGLHPVSWAIWLSSISLLGCIIAAYRRSRLPKEAVVRSATPRWNWKIIASFLLTGSLIVAAIVIARNSAIRTGTTFTQLWAVPATDADGYAIQIGISNLELQENQYELVAESRGMIINQWTGIQLAPGKTWNISMPLMEKPHDPITFLLYKEDTPYEVYRTVHLVPASFDELISSPAGP